MKKGKDGFYCKKVKRVLDIICAVMAMLFFCWLYLLVAILVKIKLGSPIIFKQERPGKNEIIFKLYKFRTMTDARDSSGNLLSDSERLTKFGRFLRATSLDELPEALNILKGNMSVVGPRPLSVKYLPYYTDEERLRHSVRPGLTGLAQINGRNSISWEEKFAYDINYIETVSLLKDISIICQTVVNVLKRKSIGQGNEAPISLHILRQSKETIKQ